MFNLRSCVYALFAASAFSDVTAFASPSEGSSEPLPSTRTQITPIDSFLASAFLKKSVIPRDAAINLMPKSTIDLASFGGMLRRSLFEVSLGKRTAGGLEQCDECSGAKVVKRMDLGVAGVTNIDPTTWEKNVTESCMGALKEMAKADNPTGMAVCYNLPFYDMGAGTFSADLRLYSIKKADPTWAAMGKNVSVSVLYSGAMVQLESTNNKRDLQERATAPAESETNSTAGTNSTDIKMLKMFSFVGKVNDEMMPDGSKTMNETMEAIKKILSPNIVLLGMQSDGTMLNMSMKTNEAAFVTGAFAAKQVTPAAPTKFVLPGTKISIVPIGLYMFSVYMVIFCGVISWGTFERYKYREQYRRRITNREESTRKMPKI